MSESFVHVGGGDAPLVIRVNGDRPTFRLDVDGIGRAALAHPDPLSLDLLTIACAVFAADGQVRRGGETRPGMGADWRRSFHFDIGVSRPEVWARPEVARRLVDAVNFLTDDDVDFAFHRCDRQAGMPVFFDLRGASEASGFDDVILFSGGLDSFAGALEHLSTTSGRVILLTHRSSQKMIPHQERLGEWLRERFPRRVLHLHVAAHLVGTEAGETTQRSRSFLFAALGQVVARAFGCRRMTFYENGIVSQNLPVSIQVAGTMATRTTHPLALRLIEVLHMAALPEAAGIVTPYAWLTKTEVVRRIAERGGAAKIRDTVSCTHIREQDRLVTHCAACSQCLDRRLAILAAGLEGDDPAEMYRHDVLTGARNIDRSRTFAVDWTRHAVGMANVDEAGLLRSYGLEVMRIMRGFPDLPQQEVLARVVAMHARHGKAVLAVLQGAIATNAAALARHELPPTSLLVMHAGAGATAGAIPERLPPIMPLDEGPERTIDDAATDPRAPLTIVLSEESGRRLIDIRGLTSLSGSLVAVPWTLADCLEEDRAAKLQPDDHRFITTGQLARDLACAKPTINQAVRRCRKKVLEAFEQVHGFSPEREPLVETRHNKGYRLEPHVRVIRRGPSGQE